MSWNSVFIFGTPNGQASTQLLQAMQRGLRAVCTTPSPVRLIASAGQTSAHVGWSQCMQTTGAVCVECARSMYSRWIIGCPLCVSHSPQACTQDWQPMQRVGSMNTCIWEGTAMYALLSSSAQSGAASALLTRTAQTLYSGIFEIGSCAAMVN